MLKVRKSVLAVLALLLAACAGGDMAPPLSPAQRMTLHIGAITIQAGRDVMVTPEIVDRITAHIREFIMMDTPKVLMSPEPGAPPALSMRVMLIAYVGGAIGVPRDQRRSAGVSQVDADVLFVDPQGNTVARNRVETHFGSSGDVGIGTNILNVEDDFERAVARLVR